MALPLASVLSSDHDVDEPGVAAAVQAQLCSDPCDDIGRFGSASVHDDIGNRLELLNLSLGWICTHLLV
jgi:hypothetical protein